MFIFAAVAVCFLLNVLDTTLASAVGSFNSTLEQRLLQADWVDFTNKLD